MRKRCDQVWDEGCPMTEDPAVVQKTMKFVREEKR